MGLNKPDLMDELQNRRTAWLFDEFWSYTSGQLWTSTLTGAATAPTVTNPNTNGGAISLGNVSTNANSSAVVQTTIKPFTFASNRSLIAEAQIQYTEANSTNAGVFFGFGSAIGATFLADTTGAPVVTGSAAGIYKQAGDTLWRAFVNVNGVQVNSGATIESSQPSPSTTFQILRVQVDLVGANIEATFFVGQRETPGADAVFPAGLQQLREAASGFNKPIKLRISSASAVAMSLGMILKQFSATSETLVVDYACAAVLRT